MSERKHPSRVGTAFLRLTTTLSGRVFLLLVLLALVINLGAVATIAWDNFDSYPEALWWSLTHVLDPGSLADDDAWDERLIGVVLVLFGLVVLLGIVIEVLTQVVDRSLRRLDEAEPPMRARDHLVVYGWSHTIPEVLARVPGRATPVAIVAPPSLRDERASVVSALRSEAPNVDATVYIDATEEEGDGPFDRANVREARSVLVYRNDTGSQDPAALELDVVERTLRLHRYLDREGDAGAAGGAAGPTVLYHLTRARDVDVVLPMFPPSYISIVVDRMITGVISLGLTNPSWGEAMPTLIGPGPGSIELLPAASLVGEPASRLEGVLPDHLPLGVLSEDGLLPVADSGDRPLAPGDLVVGLRRTPLSERDQTAQPSATAAIPLEAPTPDDAGDGHTTVLLIGWNHRIPVYIEEFASATTGDFSIVNLSTVDKAVRRSEVPDHLLDRTDVRFVTGDPQSPDDLAAVLDDTGPDVVVVSASLHDSTPTAELQRRADADALFCVLQVAARRGNAEQVIVADLLGSHPDDVYTGAHDIRVIPTAQVNIWAVARLLDDPTVDRVLDAIFEGGTYALGSQRFAPADGAVHAFSDVRAAYSPDETDIVGLRRGSRVVLAPDPRLAVHPDDELLSLDRRTA